MKFNTELYIGIRRTGKSNTPDHDGHPQPGVITPASATTKAQEPLGGSRVVVSSQGGAKEPAKSVDQRLVSPIGAFQHWKDDPTHRQGRILCASEFIEATEAAEQSPLRHSGWESTEPTKKVKMRPASYSDAVKSPTMKVKMTPPGEHNISSNIALTPSADLVSVKVSRNGGGMRCSVLVPPVLTHHGQGRMVTCRIGITLTIEQSSGVNNLHRLKEGVSHFLECFQELDGDLHLEPYRKEEIGTTTPIKTLSHINFDHEYPEAAKYVKCTNIWILHKPPITEHFVQQRIQAGQKGPTPIFARIVISSSLTLSDFTEHIKFANCAWARSDNIRASIVKPRMRGRGNRPGLAGHAKTPEPLPHLRSDMEYLQMDGKWWLAVEADMSRGRDTTTSKEHTQLPCTGAESLHCLLPAILPTTPLDQPADSTQHTDATRSLTTNMTGNCLGGAMMAETLSKVEVASVKFPMEYNSHGQIHNADKLLSSDGERVTGEQVEFLSGKSLGSAEWRSIGPDRAGGFLVVQRSNLSKRDKGFSRQRGGGILATQRSNLSKRDKGLGRQPQ